MAYYAQRDYPNTKIGTSNYTIRQVGCLLTSYSNKIKARRGKNFPPDKLNQEFLKYNAYVGDGSDLTWYSLSKINPSWVTVKTGLSQKGVNNHCIVRLAASNSFGTHFCKVYRVVGSTVYIVDSWDGQIKKSTAYGPITGWAQIEYRS